MQPLVDNSDLIKKSPLLYNQVSAFKRNVATSKTYTFVGKYDEQNAMFGDDAEELKMWLLQAKLTKKDHNNDVVDDKLYDREDFKPIVIF